MNKRFLIPLLFLLVLPFAVGSDWSVGTLGLNVYLYETNYSFSQPYLSNDGANHISLNETALNATIDARVVGGSDNNTWNTSAQMRAAVNGSYTYDFEVNWSNVLDRPANFTDTNTYNTSAQMRAAVNGSFTYTFQVNWANILSVPVLYNTSDEMFNAANNLSFFRLDSIAYSWLNTNHSKWDLAYLFSTNGTFQRVTSATVINASVTSGLAAKTTHTLLESNITAMELLITTNNDSVTSGLSSKASNAQLVSNITATELLITTDNASVTSGLSGKSSHSQLTSNITATELLITTDNASVTSGLAAKYPYSNPYNFVNTSVGDSVWALNASVLQNSSGVLNIVRAWWDGIFATIATVTANNASVTSGLSGKASHAQLGSNITAVNASVTSGLAAMYPYSNPFNFVNTSISPGTAWSINRSTLSNQSGVLSINRSWWEDLFYLKTQVDTQGEVEAIWGVTLALDNEINKSYVDTRDNAMLSIVGAQRALAGNCASGTVVQNATTGGVECIAVAIPETDVSFGNVNLTDHNLTDVRCIAFRSGGSICASS